MRIVFCRIGWAKYYRGDSDDIPRNGGSYNDNPQNIGFETYNFKNYNGKYYGYVKMDRKKSIRIERIDRCSAIDKSIDNVTVVWVADNRIVGWYKNAIVFRKYEPIPAEIIQERYLKDHDIYNVYSETAVLLREDERTFKVDKMGRSNIWYDEDNVLKDEVLKYINDYVS